MKNKIEELIEQLEQVTLQQKQIIEEINKLKTNIENNKNNKTQKKQNQIEIINTVQVLTRGKSNIFGGTVTKIGHKFITFRAEDGRLHYRMEKNLKITEKNKDN